MSDVVDRAMLDDLRHGARVISADGADIGKLHTVLVDGRDETVTRIVVNAGPHFPAPGFGSPDLIAVPVEEVADAQEDQVTLKCTERKFRDMPSFSGPPPASPLADDSDPEHRGITDIAIAVAQAFASIGGIAVPKESFKRAAFERHLFNDAPVWRNDPHEQIGEVEHVLMDELDEEVEAIVVRRGEILGGEFVLPIDYVTEIFGGIVRVDISDSDLAKLQRYEAQ